MAYDPTLGATVLFGGQSAAVAPLNDTWEFVGGVWRNITSTLPVAPAARWGAGLVYDPALQSLILFGGHYGVGLTYHDTWQFNSSGWTQLHPSTSPPPHTSTGMVYDSTDGYILLWGVNTSAPAQSYWKFEGGTWTNITTTVTGTLPPVAIYGADDPAGGGVLFYGGYSQCSGGLGVTYTYSGGVFHNLTSTESLSPAAVAGSQVMTYDPVSDGVVFFSGYSSTCAVTTQTWMFYNGSWTNLTSAVGATPPGRWGAELAFGSIMDAAITFGGNEAPIGGTNDFGNDTWEYEIPSAFDANATLTPGSGFAPLKVSFSSHPAGGTAPYRYNWSFGDGSPNSTAAAGTYTFNEPGNYSVTLSVEDAAEGFAQALFTVVVAEDGTLAFTQTGLPDGTSWSVTVGGVEWTSTNGGVANTLAPGSYTYTVGTVVGYSPTPASGMATVIGGSVASVAISYAPTSGWIAGTVTPTSASVLVDGTLVSSSGGAFNVSVAAGVHSIKVSASGYATYYNNVTVAGGSTTHVSIVEQALTTTTTSTAISTGELYAIIGAILVLAVAIIIAAVLLRGRRGKEPPAQAGGSSPMNPSASPPASGR